MPLKEGDCIRHGDIARGGVVQVVQENRDLALFEIRQQVNDSVDGRTGPMVAFGMHRDDE
jgi:hypothetical protein